MLVQATKTKVGSAPVFRQVVSNTGSLPVFALNAHSAQLPPPELGAFSLSDLFGTADSQWRRM